MESKKKRVVRSKPTRTGCRTCRIRRIKCDEAKPTCNKCSSTGRKCDGYEPGIALSDIVVQRRILPLQTSIFQNPNTSNVHATKHPNERRGFEHFLRVATRQIELRLPSAKWTRLVLQFSTELPVFRAISALGTAHHSLVQVVHVASVGPLDYDAPALGQYCSAVASLHRYLGRASSFPTFLEPVLLTCILLVCFEIVQSNTASAVSHLRLGRKLAKESHKVKGNARVGAVLKEHSAKVAGEIVSMFDQLEEDCIISSQKQVLGRQVSRMDGIGPPKPQFELSDFEDLRVELDSLITESYNLRMELLQMAHENLSHNEPSMDVAENFCRKQCLSRTVDLSEHSTILTRLARFLNSHTVWLTSFSHLLRFQGSPSRPLIFLQIQYFQSFFLLSTCRQTYETSTDIFQDQFSHTLDLIIQYLASQPLNPAPTPMRHGPRCNFTLDPGVLPTLYLIALKCRNSATRRRAISLLTSADRLEGFQKSGSLAAYAQCVVDLEERRAQALGMGLGETGEMLRAEQIPEAARFAEVVVAAQAAGPKMVRVVCGRYAYEKDGDLKVMEYDGNASPLQGKSVEYWGSDIGSCLTNLKT